MRRVLEEYGQVIIYVFIGVALIGMIWFYTINYIPQEDKPSDVTNITVVKDNALGGIEPPTLELEHRVLVEKDSVFDKKRFIRKATDYLGKDITDSITIYDAEKVDTGKKGVYIVTYVLKDDNGLVARKELSVLVD